MINKITRVFRREGLRGFYVRLRYPRKRVPSGAVPSVSLPVTVVGARALQVARLQGALELLLGSAGEDRDASDCHRIRLSPAITEAPPDSHCTVAWCVTSEVESFCRNGALARRWLRGAGFFLVPSSADFRRLAELGLAECRIFVLPSADAGTRELAGGLARWLVAAGALSPHDLDQALFPALSELGSETKLCLSMPETPARREKFRNRDLFDFTVFDGIRLQPGWVGCGWSYRTMARAALDRGAVPLAVCEDDMIPPHKFRQNLTNVEAYLAGQNWDLFSGLLTDVSETARIARVARQDGLTFVHLNYATGMVFNIYGPRVLAHLAAWSPETGSIAEHTIDTWMSRLPGLRVVTTLPFLVGHDSQAHSTLFGFANRRYDGMIRESETRLQRLVQAFEMDAPR